MVEFFLSIPINQTSNNANSSFLVGQKSQKIHKYINWILLKIYSLYFQMHFVCMFFPQNYIFFWQINPNLLTHSSKFQLGSFGGIIQFCWQNNPNLLANSSHFLPKSFGKIIQFFLVNPYYFLAKNSKPKKSCGYGYGSKIKRQVDQNKKYLFLVLHISFQTIIRRKGCKCKIQPLNQEYL